MLLLPTLPLRSSARRLLSKSFSMAVMKHTKGPEAANKFVQFVNASPTPFHAVQVASSELDKAGFTKLREQDEWDLKSGGKYYFTRCVSSNNIRCFVH